MGKAKARANGIEAFAARAYEEFLRHSRKDQDDDARRYVHRPSHLLTASGPDCAGSRFNRAAKQLDPFILLTALQSEFTANHYEEQIRFRTPFIALLIGSFGTGKSEFVLRICDFLRKFPAGETSRPTPVPINLALCRSAAKRLSENEKRTPAGFAQLVLGPLFGDKKTVCAVADAVRDGRAFLLLDALDEVIDDPVEHASFFAGLRAFLFEKGKPGPCRVLVTMREEYFHAVEQHSHRLIDRAPDEHCYLVLDRLNPPEGHGPLPVALIEVDYFTDEQIKDYLRLSLGRQRGEEVFEEVKLHFVLFSSLHRPLLLRVFADLIRDHPEALASLSSPAGHPADLIGAYIESIDRDAHQRQTLLNQAAHLAKATGRLWDFRKLARACMSLYSRGESALDRDAIAEVVGAADTESAHVDSVQMLVHKCSFLVHDLDTVRFAHRVFFEYFVARGVVDEMEELVDRGERADDSEAFNQYVLNSDMRKFLRRLVETSETLKRANQASFHQLTKKSCGFEEPAGWPMGRAAFVALRPQLERCQECLVDGMTAPDPQDESSSGRDPSLAQTDDIAEQVRWFLGQDHGTFHPLYLVYCYHAVATYLKPRWLSGIWVDDRWLFDNHLRVSLDRALAQRCTPKTGEAWQWQHLIERILFAAAWLRLRWVPGWLKEHPPREWFDAEWEPKSHGRLSRVLRDIREIFDVRDAF
ncbi:MAG: hypothetical protein C0501_21365 [Isosphaera sp.]|nr:hypothetical protein [Isosphaera sp.]